MVLREEVTSINMVETRLAFIRCRYDRGLVKVECMNFVLNDKDSNLLSGTLNTLRSLYAFNDWCNPQFDVPKSLTFLQLRDFLLQTTLAKTTMFLVLHVRQLEGRYC